MEYQTTRLIRNAVAITTVFLFLDRVTKTFFSNQTYDIFIFHPSFIRFIQHRNFGIIANIAVPQSAIILITLFFIGIVLILLFRAIADYKRSLVYSLAILLAGALGNVWDRIFHGFVFDWILLFNRSAINIADVLIITGLIGFLFQNKKDTPPIDTTH
ncbi:MAG: signal peptidase II [bacterium]|nr:signal peptidase II [bacterium]